MDQNETTDTQRTIGSIVEAKACHVTSLAECARRYGAQKSTKYVGGVVVDVIKSRNSSCLRTKTMVTADFSLGGGTVKRATLNVRSIRSVVAPEDEADPLIATNNNDSTNNATIDENVENAIVPINSPSPIEIIYNENTGAFDQILHFTREAIVLDGNTHNNINVHKDDNENTIVNPPITNPSITNQPNPIVNLPITNQPVCSPHGFNWYEDDQAMVSDTNGTYNTREWGLKTPIGDILRSESKINKRLSRLDIFHLMFPPSQLDVMVRCTNAIMREKNKKTTTKGELLKFLGVIVLMTRYEFKSRVSLWSTTAVSKYETPPCFGKTNMSRVRFDDIWTCLRWSKQPSDHTDGMSSE
jgi:Transposase IS4